ncbi:hypothetical protein LTR84_009886 [Exophiala bonariae]|uniref:Fumarylacetoacetase-like C-terminal domain-containing protein n=1 Tax=Exophiala bonariae TaxID=1690606 RepID=A0AAV9NJK9_9EURO|nr:hypothetical protein LTR84_009886 [Exophiala bonariae]
MGSIQPENTAAVPFTLATFDGNATMGKKKQTRSAIGVNGSYYDLAALLKSTLDGQEGLDLDQYSTTLAIFEEWQNTSPTLSLLAGKIASGEVKANPIISTGNGAASTGVGTPNLLAPIIYPAKLLAVGANYTGHLAEMGLPVEKWTPMPFFTRPPTTSMVGPGESVIIPESTKQFDWECELAVVVGARLRHASIAEAAAGIAGYTIGLDMSCRDLIVAGRGLGTDLMRGKAQDTMAPVGPHVVPAAYVGNIDEKRITLDVNGKRMMDASTSEMIYKCDEILSIMSQNVTLEPGDVIFTGSPAGTAGAHGDCWLKPGDRIRAEIEDVGVLNIVIRGKP